MAATLLSIVTQDDRILAVILYSDGATYKIIESLQVDRLTAAAFTDTVRGRDAQLAASAGWVKALVPGPIDLTVTPVVPPVATPAEVARAAYFRLVFQRQQALQQGRPPAEIAALETELNKQFLPEYLGS